MLHTGQKCLVLVAAPCLVIFWGPPGKGVACDTLWRHCPCRLSALQAPHSWRARSSLKGNGAVSPPGHQWVFLPKTKSNLPCSWYLSLSSLFSTPHSPGPQSSPPLVLMVHQSVYFCAADAWISFFSGACIESLQLVCINSTISCPPLTSSKS